MTTIQDKYNSEKKWHYKTEKGQLYYAQTTCGNFSGWSKTDTAFLENLLGVKITKRRKVNYWLTSDIQLHKDSQDYYEASHKYQGYVYDFTYFASRTEARREAVRLLREMQELEIRA